MNGKAEFFFRLFNVNALRANLFLWIYFIDIKVLRTNQADLMYLHFLQSFTCDYIFFDLRLISNYTANGEVILEDSLNHYFGSFIAS